MLGKPNEVVEFPYLNEIDVRYVYYDSKKMDSTWEGPRGVNVLTLSFDMKTKRLKNIRKGGS